jgi:very-short-patch-repair endonuclease
LFELRGRIEPAATAKMLFEAIMGRNKTDYFRRNKKLFRKSKRTSALTTTGSLVIPRLVHEPSLIALSYPTCKVRRFASEHRKRRISAEARMKTILTTVNGGALKGRIKYQHVISGKWIVDFFVPEIRLAIEVDGDYHLQKSQAIADLQKEKDCARFDITLVRVHNNEVFGNREALLEKLRDGWRKAKARKNTLIGTLVR